MRAAFGWVAEDQFSGSQVGDGVMIAQPRVAKDDVKVTAQLGNEWFDVFSVVGAYSEGDFCSVGDSTTASLFAVKREEKTGIR